MGCSGSRTIVGSLNRADMLKEPPLLEKPKNGTSLEDKKSSFISLDNKIIDCVNFNVTKLKKNFKNQKKQNNEKFIDDLFPHNEHSILGKDASGNMFEHHIERIQNDIPEMTQIAQDVIWLSADQIFEGNYCLFEDKIEFNDIMQGRLGDCYFLSAISAMTEFPQLICQIFKTLTVSSDGCYEIGMRINGDWQIVLLDDYFPCDKNTRKPVFANPLNNELWVMLLEKAWAKINGGYLNIIGGWSTEVLSVLTPFAMEKIKHSSTDKDIIWEKIKEGENNGYIMSCCSSNQDKEKLINLGLVPNHAFTLITAKEGKVSGDIIKLVNIRNPWGYHEWNGKWSDQSNLWTEEAKTVFNKGNNSDDGIFWMEYGDYLTYFTNTEICKVRSPCCSKTIKVPKENLDMPNVFELEIHRNTTIDICIIKKYYRFKRTIPPNQYLTTNIIVVRKEGKSLVYKASVNGITNNPNLEIYLEPGYYLIYVHVDYEHAVYDKIRKYNLYVNASNYFDLDYKGKDCNYNLLHHIISNHLKSQNKFESYIQILKNNFENTTYGFLFIWNKTKFTYLAEGKDISNNFKILRIKHLRAVIPAQKDLTVVGIRKSPWEGFCFNIDYVNKDTKEKESGIEKGDISKFLSNIIENQINEDDYVFIFKNLEIDYSNILIKIDPIENIKNYLIKKYPELMKEILSYRSNTADIVKFRDYYYYKDKSNYIGEWSIDKEWIKHGVGKLSWSDGSYYIGEFKNDKFEGKAKMYYSRGDYYECFFKNNLMDGDGIYVDIKGNKTMVCFKMGKKVKK
jgi:hypothetical protein